MPRAVTSLVSCALAVGAPVTARGDAPASAPPPRPVSGAGQPGATPGERSDGRAEDRTEDRTEDRIDHKLAVWRFDALGIEPELVARLETLFRMELDRLVRQPMPSRRDIDRAITGDARDCTGEDRCLAAIGNKLGVDVIVAGTVGQLGDNYVLTIKAVDVATARALQKIQSDPLRGQPDELIESVRVAAYRLLAPGQLLGAIQIQTDLLGAEVALDALPVGHTPLPGNGVIGGLKIGRHQLRFTVPGSDAPEPYTTNVEVHFQKVSPVVVHLASSTPVIGTGRIERIERRPFYTRTWFVVAAGVAAVGLGAAIGYAAGHVRTCHVGAGGSAGGC